MTTTPHNKERKEAVREYLIEVLAKFHRNRLEGKGFDFFFVLSNDLDELNNPHAHN